MRRSLLLVLLIAGALAPAIGAPGWAQDGDPPASEGVSIGLAEIPSDRADDPRARIYVIDHLSPGATIERTIRLGNRTDRAQRIALYVGAADLEGGEMRFAEGRSQNELSRWTTVSPQEVDVPPRSETEAVVMITVPGDASPGERYGVIWAELPSATSESGVTVVNRVGVRIYLSVGEGGEPASDFEVDTLTTARESDGAPVVKAKVHNTGGRALDMSGELELSDGPAGLSAGPFPAELGTTLGIGQTGDVLVRLDREIPDGPWTATLTLRSGELERTVRATITFPGEHGELGESFGAERVTDSMKGLILFGIALLLLLLILGCLLWYVLKRRRRRDDEDEARLSIREPEPVG
ncbi:MAG TPA: hypothetical protein VMN58_03340 [Acidimicrobiales bacterium]|nr:hypothetical protein [Acidimicrobiales bacterium]